ncbi:MAG: hypothetical protein K2N21_00350 [Rikenellaceae bacterium]|nr:hypothetical protein [Rikenellaceae bacterium]
MIIFGVRESVGEPMASDMSCPGCGSMLYAVPVHKYFHIWIIPFFPAGRSCPMVCSSCNGSFNVSHGNLPKPRVLWWTFSDLILAGMFFMWMFIHERFIV